MPCFGRRRPDATRAASSLIDEFQRNPSSPNVYAVGVCVAIPPVTPTTPLPVGTPKTGYMIESMVTATTHNIDAAIEGREHRVTEGDMERAVPGRLR